MAASLVAQSVTNREIACFWKRKRLVEEDHLYAAIKAAARLRARNLSVDDYLQFVSSLKEEDADKENEVSSSRLFSMKGNRKAGIGTKDWWTKSKHAYLNQPATTSLDSPGGRRRSCAHLPHLFSHNSASPHP